MTSSNTRDGSTPRTRLSSVTVYVPAWIGLVLAVDCHLDDLGGRGELLDAMLAEICFGMGGNQLRLSVPEVLEDLEYELPIAPRQVEQLIAR